MVIIKDFRILINFKQTIAVFFNLFKPAHTYLQEDILPILKRFIWLQIFIERKLNNFKKLNEKGSYNHQLCE